jgi:small subunit ribosomal protein S2
VEEKGGFVFSMAVKISLKDLLEAGCHFGHQSSRWDPKMKPYIFTARDGIHVFDLAKTKEGLEAAMAYVKEITREGKIIIFVGSKRQAKEVIKEVAQSVGMPYVSERWLGGTFTNWEQIKGRIGRLKDLKEKREKGEFKKFTKKERLLIDREIARLEKLFGGIDKLEDLPEAIFVVDTKRELAAVKEANKRGIKVVGLVDTNSDPDLIDYVIPANDDAVKSIELIVKKIGEAIKEQPKSKAKSKKGKNDKNSD